MKLGKMVLGLMGLWMLTSCEKAEPLYKMPAIPAGLQTQTFNMGENYENQLWFQFATQTTTTNAMGIWDIAFASTGIPNVMINGGKNASMGLFDLGEVPFGQVQTLPPGNIPWTFDNPNGSLDSLAVGTWFRETGPGYFESLNHVYLIDRGVDSLGSKRYVKLMVINRVGGVYHFVWGYLGELFPSHDEYIHPSTDKNMGYFSFDKQTEVYNEPLKNTDWDIVFTTYKKYIPDNNGKPYPYIIRGVLINPSRIQVVQLDGKVVSFNDITYEFAKNQQFGNVLDEIGFDWKVWNMSANRYTVDQTKIYLLKDNQEQIFKLKFVDFYNDQGIKGYPKMAWELLKP